MKCEKHSAELTEYKKLRGKLVYLCEKCCLEKLNSDEQKIKAEKERIEQDLTSWPVNYPY